MDIAHLGARVNTRAGKSKSLKFTVLEKGGKPKVLEDMVEIYFRNKG